MKTNQIMTRPMGQFKVQQRTKDGYFNATALLKQWNNTNGSKEEIEDYLKSHSKLVYERDGDLVWMDNYNFGNLLIYLDPRLFFVDFQIAKLDWRIEDEFREAIVKHKKCDNKIVYTYVLKDKSGLYKIGKSVNVERRIKSISTGNTTIEKVMVLPIDCEGYLHSYFSNKRIRGEWFKLNNEDIKFIEKINKNK